MEVNTLFLTNREDISIEYLIEKYRNVSENYLRINSEDVELIEFDINPAGKTKCYIENSEYNLSTVKSVLFKRTPTRFNNISDNENKAYLNNEKKHFFEGLYLSIENAKWVNPMFATHIAERKIYQLKVANQLGLNIPKSVITNQLSRALSFLKENPISIIKPISNGLQVLKDRTYSIYTTEITHQAFIDLELAEIFSTPVFLQERIKNDSDIRVTIVGNNLFAAQIRKEGDDVDWRKPDIKKLYDQIILPLFLQEKLLELNRFFKMIYSAIDLILTPHGEYIFLEINPVGEWVWLEQELDFGISACLINELL
ncbi:hypothetical protein [Mucilaginibacter panaciglaebae]|uniref:ATP-grasp domain-containing protein n=1 Tax=Mucilaginibacter panaciglaebae TaxID=502331 RepID=A0ABP7WK42_9SPHI